MEYGEHGEQAQRCEDGYDVTAMKYLLLLVTTLLALSCGPSFQEARPDSRPPNFVVIFIDDMGYGDIGPFGSTLNRTPNLDRMAAEGMKLTSFYAAPVCTPSRASLMTGSYPIRNGLQTGSWHGVLMPSDEHGIHPDEITVAELLQERGYATACIGKWHLGDQPPFLPTRNGFDYYYGLPYSNDMNPDAPRNIRNHPPLPLLRGEKMRGEEVLQEVKDQSFLTGAYTKEAIQFIEKHRDEPFFVYLPHSMVHVPLYAGEEFRGKSNNGILGDAIEELDWSVGEILGKLRELGLDDNTLVIFTSDNGPARGSAGPLRDRKGSTYEGGMREPTIAWAPGMIPAGSSYNGVTSTMDLLPTLAALAGAEVPTDRVIDGYDISAILGGEIERESPHEFFYYYRGYELRAVRGGDWKLHANGVLYDLGNDIAEVNDVSREHAEIVAKLRSALETALVELGDGPAWPGDREVRIGAKARPVGKVESPKFLIPRPGQTGEAAHSPVIQGKTSPPPPGWQAPANW